MPPANFQGIAAGASMNAVIAPRIMLVEDDAMFRETVRDTLRGTGHQVVEAEDGQQALELVTTFRPDLVLLDFDLPRMMGDEALERMLDVRPGLICYVLSGKDDLHQALWMGRHGAYGWIDKYVGTDRLLATVAEGLRLRPRGYDLRRLITNYYPQPIALQYVRLARLEATASVVERLAHQRDLFEVLAQYVAVTLLALYLERGLLEEDLNRQLLPAIESPSPARWVDAAGLLARQFVDETATDWRCDLARSLLQPLLGAESLSHCASLVQRQAPSSAAGESRSLLGFWQSLIAFHPLWITPERISSAVAAELAAALGVALEELLGALSVLADTELLHVQQVSVARDGSFEPRVAVLSGLTVAGRSLSVDQRPAPGELLLARRRSNQYLARVSPLLIFDNCEPGGMVPQGVFGLSQIHLDRGATYLSFGCGHVRLYESPQIVEALRHLFYSLDPTNARSSHLLRNLAVGLIDLSGYTTLTRQHGPAVARESVHRMVSAARDAARRHGGYVADPVGDEVLVSFADPKEAVAATVETMETLDRLNARNPQVALHVHVGLDYGCGVVEQHQVWGDVVNRAKRCQTIAQADEIVISPSLAAALGTPSPWPLEAVTGNLKGFGEVEVFQVRWSKPS